MVTLAFYKGKGNWLDRLIRRVTRSPFSHVELISSPHVSRNTSGEQVSTLCISSSARDGGVREKPMFFRIGRWQFLDCPWVVGDPAEVIRTHVGTKYDYLGIVLSQILNLRRHGKTRWFCSEIVGHALGLNEPHRLSPSDLYLRVSEMNGAYESGILEALNQQ